MLKLRYTLEKTPETRVNSSKLRPKRVSTNTIFLNEQSSLISNNNYDSNSEIFNKVANSIGKPREPKSGNIKSSAKVSWHCKDKEGKLGQKDLSPQEISDSSPRHTKRMNHLSSPSHSQLRMSSSFDTWGRGWVRRQTGTRNCRNSVLFQRPDNRIGNDEGERKAVI